MAIEMTSRDWSVTSEKIGEAVRRLIEVADPLQVILFGSRARGDFREDSDVDLAVILDGDVEDAEARVPWDTLIGLKMEVTLIVASQAKYDLHRPWLNSVFHYIDQEGVVVYDRNNPEPARANAVRMASEDESTLQYPLPDAIFGFHAQQSCEKLFKALIAAHGVVYPFTHSLQKLIGMLEENGETLPVTAYPVVRLEAYAVKHRYDLGGSLPGTDKASIRETVVVLREFVVGRVLEMETPSSL